MKAAGNITLGKTIDRHLAAETLKPGMVVRFYGAGTPDRFTGRDVKVTGWYNNRHGGLTFTLRTHLGETVIDRHLTDKVGVYADQTDAARDYREQYEEYRAAMAAGDWDKCKQMVPHS